MRHDRKGLPPLQQTTVHKEEGALLLGFFLLFHLLLLFVFLEAFMVLLVFLPLCLKAIRPIAVVTSALAVVAHVESGVHLGQWVHTQNFVDLAERE